MSMQSAGKRRFGFLVKAETAFLLRFLRMLRSLFRRAFVQRCAGSMSGRTLLILCQ